MKISVRTLVFAAFFSLLPAGQIGQVTAQEPLLVFAPASMTDVMAELADAYKKQSNQTIKLSIAGTAQLARQIDNGAPADVFISADQLWVDWLTERNRLEAKTVGVIAENELVVAVRVETENWADAKALLTGARFAMAEPLSIPAGRYAKQAMETLGIWEQALAQAVYGENVRITLRQLALGEVGAAVVYATDVAVEPAVKTAWTFPSGSYDRALYIAAVVKGADREGEMFLSFLLSKQAQQILKTAGFKPASESR